MRTVILRTNVPRPSSKIFISAGAQPDTLTFESADLDARQRAELGRDPGVIAHAPAFPMKLIRPLHTSTEPAAQPPAVSWGIQDIDAAKPGFTGANVIVAVLDTGIDKKHPAFAGVVLQSANFTEEPDEDFDGHGTHCAGTIFGRDCDGCRIGVARGITRALSVKVIGRSGGSSDSIFKAILWAVHEGAHIISMSLGMDFTAFLEELLKRYEPEVATSMALVGYRENLRLFDRLSIMLSSQQAITAGAVVVAAAGNESRRDVHDEFVVALNPPAVADHFISVGALQRTGPPGGGWRIAPFSNTGVRLVAPGTDIWSAQAGGRLVRLSGTSMATPHVAGVAALWAEKLMRSGQPFQAARVISALERNVKQLPDLPFRDAGLGLVQAP